MNLIKHLSREHDFTVLAPLRDPQAPSLTHAGRYNHFIPIFLPPPPPRRSRLYYIFNGWRQALFNQQPRLVKTFYSPVIRQAVEKEIAQGDYDLIQIQQLLMVQYLPSGWKKPCVLDVDNLWSKLLPRMAETESFSRWTHRLQTTLDLRKIPAYERKCLRRFNACLAISSEEAQTIQQLAPKSLVSIIPNGVDYDYFNPGSLYQPAKTRAGQDLQTQPPILLFTGTMAWEPNVDAVLYFSTEILPLIHNRLPHVRFIIVGREPRPEVLQLANQPGIQVSGFVEDVRPFLARSAVFVAPIRAGVGTRLKILEALATGKPVVTTSLGVGDLEAEHNQHLLIADQPADFAAAVIELIAHPEHARQLGENGRQLALEKYDWKAIAGRLGQVYQDLVSNEAG